ncbi:carboxymuconolactone decarboxylase family protein [Microbulbifer sp. 2201CG32-9]|uniref:carboxymuconolactone decarboxylase family protein n=1 Tax=Microbulbifer sp. 2201CG32-9 TaxID=3232309 RepID=UPI00345B69A0
MDRITLVESSADKRVAAIFQEILDEKGCIPNIYRAYAHDPRLLETNWSRFKALMIGGCLSVVLKECIALVVATDNQCDYFIRRHTAVLQELGVDPQEVLRIRTHPDEPHLSPKDHALLELARYANLTPYDHGERWLDAAQAQGASDEEIVEALGMMEWYAGASKLAAILNLPSDY